MNIIINAKNGTEARQIAEERYPEFYYVRSKKISTHTYQITMNRRKMLMRTSCHYPLWLEVDVKVVELSKLFNNFVTEIVGMIKNMNIELDEVKIVKRINTLHRDIKKLIEE